MWFWGMTAAVLQQCEHSSADSMSIPFTGAVQVAHDPAELISCPIQWGECQYLSVFHERVEVARIWNTLSADGIPTAPSPPSAGGITDKRAAALADLSWYGESWAYMLRGLLHPCWQGWTKTVVGEFSLQPA